VCVDTGVDVARCIWGKRGEWQNERKPKDVGPRARVKGAQRCSVLMGSMRRGANPNQTSSQDRSSDLTQVALKIYERGSELGRRRIRDLAEAAAVFVLTQETFAACARISRSVAAGPRWMWHRLMPAIGRSLAGVQCDDSPTNSRTDHAGSVFTDFPSCCAGTTSC